MTDPMPNLQNWTLLNAETQARLKAERTARSEAQAKVTDLRAIWGHACNREKAAWDDYQIAQDALDRIKK